MCTISIRVVFSRILYLKSIVDEFLGLEVDHEVASELPRPAPSLATPRSPRSGARHRAGAKPEPGREPGRGVAGPNRAGLGR